MSCFELIQFHELLILNQFVLRFIFVLLVFRLFNFFFNPIEVISARLSGLAIDSIICVISHDLNHIEETLAA